MPHANEENDAQSALKCCFEVADGLASCLLGSPRRWREGARGAGELHLSALPCRAWGVDRQRAGAHPPHPVGQSSRRVKHQARRPQWDDLATALRPSVGCSLG